MARRSSPATTMAALASPGWWLSAVAIAAWISVVPATSAADGEREWILDRPIIDVAVIERGGGLSPDLLTLDLGAADRAVRVTLLRRDAAWSILGETRLDVPSRPFFVPWLVDIGEGRFAVVQVVGQGGSVVVPLSVDPSSPANPVRIGATVRIANMVTASGAADVDGDGTRELVVASPQTDDPGSCAGDKVEVLSGDDLQERDTFLVPRLRLEGAALGEWDGRPGTDLLANAYEPCLVMPDSGERHHMLSIRLRDGSTIVDLPAAETEATYHWPSLPLVVDVDGDGRDEAIVRDDSTVSIVDPTDGWRSLSIAGGNTALLIATSAPDGSASALVTSIEVGAEPNAIGVTVRRITRVGGSLSAGPAMIRTLADVQPVELERMLVWLQNVELSEQPPLAWSRDLDGDGCPEVVAPLVRAGCLGTVDTRLGPLWLATRPLAVVGPAGDQRLLTAVGLEWDPSAGSPTVPAPAAAGSPGLWRLGASVEFALAEATLPGAADEPATPVAAALVDATASADGLIDLEGPTGMRLLVRASALSSTEPAAPPGDIATRSGFALTDTRPAEFTALVRIPVPSGSVPGASLGSVPFDIRGHVRTATVAPADRWTVHAAVLDAQGSVSDPVAATVVYDVTAPPLSLDTPFLSPPWPFEATVRGTSEAGVSVRLSDGMPVAADRTGAFEVRAQLAPWPQTVEVTAVDPSGNAASTRASVMGGLDLRQLPWPAILAVTVIAAVALSSLLGGRRVRPAVSVTVLSDDDHLPVIEELSSGPTGRRD